MRLFWFTHIGHAGVAIIALYLFTCGAGSVSAADVKAKSKSKDTQKLIQLIGANPSLSLDQLNARIASQPSARAYLERAAGYLVGGDPEQAIKDYSASIKLNTGFANAYLGRAKAYETIDKTSLALQDWQKAASLADRRVALYAELQLAEFYGRAGKHAESISHYTKSLALCDGDAFRISSSLSLRADQKLQNGDAKGAIDDVNESFKHHEIGETYEIRALAYRKLGKLNDALADINRAISKGELLNRRDEFHAVGTRLGELYAFRAELYDMLGNKALAQNDRAAQKKIKNMQVHIAPFRMNE